VERLIVRAFAPLALTLTLSRKRERGLNFDAIVRESGVEAPALGLLSRGRFRALALTPALSRKRERGLKFRYNPLQLRA
jgi:hypothetical protein